MEIYLFSIKVKQYHTTNSELWNTWRLFFRIKMKLPLIQSSLLTYCTFLSQYAADICNIKSTAVRHNEELNIHYPQTVILRFGIYGRSVRSSTFEKYIGHKPFIWYGIWFLKKFALCYVHRRINDIYVRTPHKDDQRHIAASASDMNKSLKLLT